MRLYDDTSVSILKKAQLYAGKYINGELIPKLNLTIEQREHNAILCANKAIQMGNDEARIFLAESYLVGKGCIQPNISKYTIFYNNLITNKKFHLNVALELGCLYLGYDLAGNKLSKYCRYLPFNATEGINNLRMALNGNNIKIIKTAIRILNYFFPSYKNTKHLNILRFIEGEVLTTKNPILALFLAYAYCPPDQRSGMDIQLQDMNTKFKCEFVPPREFDKYVKEQSFEECEKYLKMAMMSRDLDCQAIAEILLDSITPSLDGDYLEKSISFPNCK